MSDKTRDEFEYWASNEWRYPRAVERSGEGYSLAQTQTYWIAWLAAKEKYEPRWIPVSERMPEPGQLVDYYFEAVGVWYGKYVGDGKSNEFASRAGFLGDDVTHWRAAPDAPSTQGGGE